MSGLTSGRTVRSSTFQTTFTKIEDEKDTVDTTIKDITSKTVTTLQRLEERDRYLVILGEERLTDELQR